MRIVGSITTIPDRIKHITPVLRNILDQTRLLDKLYINIPYISLRGKEYDITQLDLTDLPNKDIICVNRIEKDYGSLSKLLPTLYHENDPDTLILTFDDDMMYGNKVVEIMENKATQYPDSALSFSGIIYGHGFFSYYLMISNTKDVEVDWIQGTHVCSYRRKMLTIDGLLSFKDIKSEKIREIIPKKDDMWISYNVEKNGYNCMSIGYPVKEHCKMTELCTVSALTPPEISTMLYSSKLAKYFRKNGAFNASPKGCQCYSISTPVYLSLFVIFILFVLYSKSNVHFIIPVVTALIIIYIIIQIYCDELGGNKSQL